MSVQDTRNKTDLAALRSAVGDLVALVNQSPLGGRLVREAKLPLDPALLRIAGAVYRFGPIGLVDLAERAGRDHTTVSRQVAKLEALGLVERRQSAADKRVSEVALTAKGRRTGEMLFAAQEKVMAPILAKWSDKDLGELTRLLRRLTEDLAALKDS
jgi:DNA-binding MarR family transcriptional regulator